MQPIETLTIRDDTSSPPSRIESVTPEIISEVRIGTFTTKELKSVREAPELSFTVRSVEGVTIKKGEVFLTVEKEDGEEALINPKSLLKQNPDLFADYFLKCVHYLKE